MCIVAIAQEVHPAIPLVIVANRDEYINRPSLPPDPNNVILCTRDLASEGSCIGLNTETGTFVTTTNIGRGGQKGYNRGKLVRSFLESPEKAELLLKDRGCYCGFNLAWLNIYEKNPTDVNWCCNRHPSDTDETCIHQVKAKIVIVANDMIGDEHVKSEFLKTGVRRILSRVALNTDLQPADIANIRDQFGDLMCSKQTPPSWVNWLCKLFWFSPTRRVQPGFQTLLWTFFIATLLFALGGFSLAQSSVVGFALGLLSGMYHHSKLNHLYTVLRIPGLVSWGTISQTVIIKTRDRNVYYFYRDTVEKNSAHEGVAWKIGEWHQYFVHKK